ncbi:DUF1993 domain-containing protein [Caballeronia sp. SEWSISQ10-4 2]|uniref:DUF1993 domain-containing protein n=1 Tax=Caballeronia sp. SEWSISQ10-4 2 TaxID=2937438 RepID=UPI00264CA93D|nr:DUF1993 domain-containing protein [Caballeronia sp. SEWSISQ10-4 2]MDN7177342.1 DUF1993 domain-containing protein [Caballeronia sp. SEWSISQ10-4 2]
MKISMHTMAVDSFVPMLESLSAILDKGVAHARQSKIDLVNARLAPDMCTLAQQVRLACLHAEEGTSRLTGRVVQPVSDDETTIDGLQRLIATTLENLKGIGAAAFEGAEDRDCNIPLPGKMMIAMDGLQFLRAWALPHFYFHVVTAYDILRHSGVVIGKQDYLSQIGNFVCPRI